MPTHQTAVFVEVLRRLAILEPAQLDDLAGQLHQWPEPRFLARDLVRRGWLTAFQLPYLADGRGRDLLLGDYLLLDHLGAGGMGQVYKARHQKLCRLVALKVIRPDRLQTADAVKRFRREAEAAARLDHPNVVKALDAGPAGAALVFAMEFIEGIDLGRVVVRGGPLPWHQACDCARQAALGLQHAHDQGLVHRDVKPTNLLLTVGGQVKVLDLGLARREFRLADTASSSITQTGVIVGTPDYIAPEQCRDASAVDARADLYSLGATLYFLLTGRPPFPDGDLMGKLFQHCFQAPPPVAAARPGLPPAVAAVVHRLLAKAPGDRYPSAAAVAEALAPLARPADAAPTAGVYLLDGEADGDSLVRRFRARRRRRHLTALAALAAFTVGAVLAFGLMLKAGAAILQPREATAEAGPGPLALPGPGAEHLTYWAVLGPFPVPRGDGLDDVPAPEREPAFDRQFPRAGGRAAAWQGVGTVANRLDLRALLGDAPGIAFAATVVESPADAAAVFHVALAATGRVFLNGQPVAEAREPRPLDPAAGLLVPVRLTRGANTLVVKVVRGEEWGLAVRLTKPDGQPLPGVRVRLPDGVPRGPGPGP